jgi:hypothetical protein
MDFGGLLFFEQRHEVRRVDDKSERSPQQKARPKRGLKKIAELFAYAVPS